jgi:hypothetical protein
LARRGFLSKGANLREMLVGFLRDFPQLHNQESAKRMELPLEELKAPMEVHFADWIPHPTKLQAKDVPLQLGNWRGKVDFLVSTLGGMEFITRDNVLMEGHNRLVRIPSKNGIVQMKAHEVPSVGGTTIHLMLGN